MRDLLVSVLREREVFYSKIFEGKFSPFLIVRLLVIATLFFAVYGFVMGMYNSPIQAISSMVKVPMLFLLSLMICYPALFVFNILLGSRLDFAQSFAMILSAYVLTAAIMVSFVPMVIFFILTGSGYSFLQLLHVGIFSIAGIAGMSGLNGGLKQACEYHSIYPKQGVRVFQIWVVIFAFVGTQLAWNLRPFLGSKDMPFQLFRKQESNFYAHIFHIATNFFKTDESKPVVGDYSGSQYFDPHRVIDTSVVKFDFGRGR